MKLADPLIDATIPNSHVSVTTKHTNDCLPLSVGEVLDVSSEDKGS